MSILAGSGKSLTFAVLICGLVSGAFWAMAVAAGPQDPAPRAKQTTEAQPTESSGQQEVQRDKLDQPLPKGVIARLGSSLFRHGGYPSCPPAFSADGKHIACASEFGVYVFDQATGRLIRHIQLADKSHPRLIRFLRDGKRIAVSSVDWQKTAELVIYDLADGNATARSTFHGTNGQIYVIDFNADASKILVQEWFNKVFLWDAKAEKEIWSFEHAEASHALSLTSDGKRFILPRRRTAAELRDASNGELIAQFPQQDPEFASFGEATVSSLDGKLAIASQDGKAIAILDAQEKTERMVNATDLKSRMWRRLFFSPDSRYLVAASDRETRVWDITAAEQKEPVVKLPGTYNCSFSPDGKTLALNDLGCLTFWRVGEWKKLPESADPGSAITTLRFVSDGKQIVGRAREGWLIWPAGGGPAKRLGEEAMLDIEGLSRISADGRVAVDVFPEPGQQSGRGKSIVRVIEVATGKVRRFPLDFNPWSVNVCPGGRYIMAMTSNKTKDIVVLDAETGKVLHEEDLSSTVLFGAEPAPDGKGIARLVSGKFGKTNVPTEPMYSAVTVKDYRTSKEWNMAPMPWSIYVDGAQFSRDGSKIVLQGRFDDDFTHDSVSVWDIRTKRRLFDWPTVTGRMEGTTLSLDGRSLLTGNRAGHLELVEVATGQARTEIRHGSTILCVAFDPTGLRCVASSPDAPVYVWDLLGQTVKWDAAEPKGVWADLASANAKTGYTAIRLLRANSTEAIAFLREHVQVPTKPKKESFTGLLKQLDSTDFAEREKAQKDMVAIAEFFTSEIEEAMKGDSSAEARQRLEKIQESLEIVTPERLRQIRACEVLEGIATPDAIKVLRIWSIGPERSRLTTEAKESLERIRSQNRGMN